MLETKKKQFEDLRAANGMEGFKVLHRRIASIAYYNIIVDVYKYEVTNVDDGGARF